MLNYMTLTISSYAHITNVLDQIKIIQSNIITVNRSFKFLLLRSLSNNQPNNNLQSSYLIKDYIFGICVKENKQHFLLFIL